MEESPEIGAYETKTKLPDYLRKVAAARRMRAFVERHRPTKKVDIKSLIDEGRD